MIKKLDELFTLLEKEFPYPTGFKGSHFITRNQGALILNTWCNGQCWMTGLEEGDFDDLPALVAGVRRMVENWPKDGACGRG